MEKLNANQVSDFIHTHEFYFERCNACSLQSDAATAMIEKPSLDYIQKHIGTYNDWQSCFGEDLTLNAAIQAEAEKLVAIHTSDRNTDDAANLNENFSIHTKEA